MPNTLKDVRRLCKDVGYRLEVARKSYILHAQDDQVPYDKSQESIEQMVEDLQHDIAVEDE